MKRDFNQTIGLGVLGTRKEPAIFAIHWECPGGQKRPEFAVTMFGVVRILPIASPPMRVNTVQARAVQCRMQRMVRHVRQRPRGGVARQRAVHGPAIAEEENVDGLKEERIHAMRFGWEFSSDAVRVRWAKAAVCIRPMMA